MIAVGRLGVKIRRVKPNHKGEFVENLGFHDVWPSEEAIKAEIAERPGPVRPRAPRAPGT